MTFLSAAQSAAIRLVGQRPSAFWTSSDQFALEICDLANDVAENLMRAADWRVLTKFHTINGDGSTVAFDLPADYDRMLVKGAVFRPSWNTWHYSPASDLDQWRDLLNGQPSVTPGYWILLDGKMQIWPAVPVGDGAQFYYISKNCVKPNSGDAKAKFTADNDTFLLDETLLTLGLIWRWRQQKRMEYAEDLQNFEHELEERSGKDRGSHIVAVGNQTINSNVGMAYPWPLGGF